MCLACVHVHSDGKISNWDKLQAALDRGPESTTVQSRVQDDVTEAINEQNAKLFGEHVHWDVQERTHVIYKFYTFFFLTEQLQD